MAVFRGRKLTFGYYINPLDPHVALPDKDVLDALHYSFRMRAKFGTSLRDCTMWLHAATGRKITPHGYLYKYKRWLKAIKQEHKEELKVQKAETSRLQQNYVDENFKDMQVTLDSVDDITSVASAEIRKETSLKA